MKIIESHKEWESFMKEFQINSSVVVPVQCDDNKHPLATNLCLIYIRLLGDVNDNTEEYILPFRHSDAINLEKKYLGMTRTEQTVFTYDKKKLLHFLDWDDITDIQMKNYLDKNVPMPLDQLTTNSHDYFHRIYWGKSNINCIIPIMKHLEMSRLIVDEIKKCVFTQDQSCFGTYNNDVIPNLHSIEKNGLQTTNGMVFSEYNLYTATGRPSNRFGGTNFAALNKSDGSRKKPDRVVFNDKELLKDNLSNTIPTVLDLAWAINYVDISNTLYGACGKLFYDADVSSWEERLRRAEAVHILGSQFYLVGLEVTGGNTTSTGNVDDIKAQANAAFMESLKNKGNDEM